MTSAGRKVLAIFVVSIMITSYMGMMISVSDDVDGAPSVTSSHTIEVYPNYYIDYYNGYVFRYTGLSSSYTGVATCELISGTLPSGVSLDLLKSSGRSSRNYYCYIGFELTGLSTNTETGHWNFTVEATCDDGTQQCVVDLYIGYQVTFETQGGDTLSTGSCPSSDYPTAIILPSPGSVEGMECTGWYTAASGGTRVGGVGSSYVPTSDITLYAQWGEPTHTITYNGNGGTSGSVTVIEGESTTLPSSSRTGYTFNGWYTAASGGTRVGGTGSSYTPTSDITLYAQWTQIKYTVTYNGNGGTSGSSSATVNYGGSTTLPSASRTGYTFDGWYNAASGGTKIGNAGASYKPTSNITLYAHWTINKYTVTYNGNGGTSGSSTLNYGTVTQLPNSSRTGYTFNGWYTAASGGSYVGTYGSNYTVQSNVTLYAHWTINEYTVTFNGNGGTAGSSSITKDYGTSISLPSASRTGYTFNGWYTAASGGTKIGNAGASYTVQSNVTLYAQWTLITYTVTFNGNGGTPNSASTTVDYGNETTLPTVVREGYTFNGWYTASSGGTKIGNAGASYTPTSSVTLYAQWTQIKYTVTYNGNGGTAGASSITVVYAESTSLPSASRTGYTFNGWYTASSGGTKIGNAGDDYTPTSSVTLYAQWTQIKYTVTYNGNGGTAGSTSATVTYGNSTSLPSASRTGYTFNGWYTATSGGTKVGSAGASYTPTSDVTLHAQWTLIRYVVTYDGNSGTPASSSATVNYGSSTTLPSASRTGYTFNGWYTAASGGTKIGNAGASYTPKSDVTLYAQWTQINLTVSSVATQYAVVGQIVSFTASTTPSGVSVTYTADNKTSGLNVDISGSTITCSAQTAGTYTFTLKSSSSGYATGSTTVTVVVVNVLSFSNTPSAGAINN